MPQKKKPKKKRTVEAQRSGFLFTHRGYSGPSVLDLSHHAILALEGGAPKPRVVVDWTGEVRRRVRLGDGCPKRGRWTSTK